MDHVYLHENESTVPVRDALADFIDSGFVTYKTVSGGAMQNPVYTSCDDNYRHLWNWIMYLDADEYLHVRDPYASDAATLHAQQACTLCPRAPDLLCCCAALCSCPW